MDTERSKGESKKREGRESQCEKQRGERNGDGKEESARREGGEGGLRRWREGRKRTNRKNLYQDLI